MPPRALVGPLVARRHVGHAATRWPWREPGARTRRRTATKATQQWPPRYTFEVPLRASDASVARMLNAGKFGAAVYTDLPEQHRYPRAVPAPVAGAGLPSVCAVAACRWGGYNGFKGTSTAGEITAVPGGDLEQRLRGTALNERARAWLLVSGDAVLWKNPNPKPPSLRDLMSLAGDVRSSLDDPPDVWVAYNPLADDAAAEAAHLSAKADWGGRLAVLQPPSLLPDRAAAAFEALDATARALPKLVGIAAPSTAKRFALWLKLCRVTDDGGAVARWEAAEAAGDARFAAFRRAFLAQAFADAASVPGAVGFHVMPWDTAGSADVAGVLGL